MKIALAGNPNCGKTTMFNGLTGSKQYVGNWPGVTVEKKEGRLKGKKDVTIVDLPGIYSLSPYTLEEVVSREYLLTENPDAIINLVDATNLERNLYLTTQLIEIGIPVIIALNMMDVVNKSGDKIDVKRLGEELGCEIVETSALKGDGIALAAEKAVKIAGRRHSAKHRYSPELEGALEKIGALVSNKVSAPEKRWFEIKLFERDEKIENSLNLSPYESKGIEEVIKEAESKFDEDSESIVINERYAWISSVVSDSMEKLPVEFSISDKIDRIVTNRWLALPIFIAVMFFVYYISVSTVGSIVTDFTNDTLFGEWIQPAVASALESIGTAGWVISLVVDGIISGVGAIIGFVPQMMVLFIFLAILEDCGYMARIAFIMDRIFKKFGLSGKSFIPMLISSGCGVPGIMATKTIENDKDRRMTIMTTTFVPCGAKLPVIALIIGVMSGSEMGGWVAPMFYFLGIAAVIVSGLILKKTKPFAGKATPFLMELPPYHMPKVSGVLIHMWDRAKSFIKKAGTVIFASSVIIWFLSNFGWVNGIFGYLAEEELMNVSILAIIGNSLAWLFAPLGFGNWQATVASFIGLTAKENVVSTLGVLFGLGSEAGESSPGLWGQVSLLMPAAHQLISFLAFNLLCAPCFAAIAAIRREMASARWTAFAISYQCVFAYSIALMINQFGAFFTAYEFTAGTLAAVLVLTFMLFMLLRPDTYKKKSKLESTLA